LFCVRVQQHGLTSMIHHSSRGMMFASVKHAELENGNYRWQRRILPLDH
jgi:hypothetical protein